MSEFLKNKVAVVTGASRGLGRAMSLALAARGVKVALAGRDSAKLDETAGLIRSAGGDCAVFVLDVTQEDEVAEFARKSSEQLGPADILINNAGMNLRKPLVDFTLEEWRRVMDTNFTSVFLMCRAFVPQMKGRGYGRILNLTSIMSHVSLPGRAAYSSSKTALLGLTRALALELAPDGITVAGISPGPFATEINTAILNDPEANRQFLSKIPVGQWGQPADLGELVVYLCSPAANFITGTDIVIDGGWLAQ
jgi:NAD(P)-dependent dehydrogenase (short-subunit alcohol dehydrogenase family)